MAVYSLVRNQRFLGANMTLPNSFRAAVLFHSPGCLKITDIKMPVPKHGQVLVKVTAAGVCRSQLMEIQGKRGEDRYLPHMMGHEGVGEVVAIGKGVSKVRVGQRVILGWIKATGLDSGGTVLETTAGQKINAGPVTTFAEYTLVSENRLTHCPDDLADELAVLLGCALPTGAGLVLNEVKPRDSSTVLLIGLGGIGVSALLMLNYFKPKEVVVVDTQPEKLTLAKKLGATTVYLAGVNIRETLSTNHPQGFDYAIESAGSCKTIELAFDNVHNRGICYFASHPAAGEKISLDPHALICGKQINGTWGGNCQPDKDLPKIAEIIQNLDISVPDLVSDYYSLENINEAISTLESGKVFRSLINTQAIGF